MSRNFSFYKPFKYLVGIYILINFILRVVLINHPITTSSFGIGELMSIFLIGALRDISIFVIAYILFWVYFIFLSDAKYKKPYGYITFGLLVALWAWVTFGRTILHEYGGVLPEIGIIFLSIKTTMYGLCLFFPKNRTTIRKINYAFVLFIFVLILIQNSVSEFFFWNEFGVRFNFIAVDYLVYTNEVIGNIMESYPVVPLFTGVGLITVICTYIVYKKTADVVQNIIPLNQKIIYSLSYLALFAISLFASPYIMQQKQSDNIFTAELSSNGVYKFYSAFTNSVLDYFHFYKTLPQEDVAENMRQFYPGYKEGNSLLRKITADSPIQKKNVVLISIESYSADFLSFYGNEKKLTPFLDSLATKSLFFTNVYATGNRTVRGLEAMTMCIPPSPGESVVKRKDNKNKFTTGSVFAKNGYETKYLYGGDAYFDNMRDYYEGNDYNIVDKSAFTPEEISFQNIWGVCDEDMFAKAIKVMNKEHATGKPFFNQIMTVSNHRPFTYPEGVLDVSDLNSGRDKGVRYTDYSIAQFFKMAAKQPWFENTVFVIMADHCASSAGKTQLPLDKYRIPAMIYAPNGIPAQQFDKVMSQIDVMPTLLGLLNFSYDSKFFGTDVLNKNYIPRAFIATYQDLGYIRDNTLTILSANKNVQQYLYSSPQINNPVIPLVKNENINQKYVDEAISFYQFTADQLDNKNYNKL